MKKLILLAIFLLFTRTAQADLVSWWKLDEPSWNGTTNEVVDSSGSGNHGTSSGGATTIVGHEQRAGKFDGVNDYVDTNYVITGQTATVELWVKFNRLGQDFFGNTNHAGGTSNKGFNIATDSSGNGAIYVGWYELGVNWGVRIATAPAGTVTIGQWYHIVSSMDAVSDKKHYLYVNGVLKASCTINYYDNNGDVWIGRDYPTHYANVTIDEVKIYNHALTANEVAQEYYLGSKTRLRNATIK